MSKNNGSGNSGFQPILCVSKGQARFNVALLNDENGFATYTTAGHPDDLDETNTFQRPIAEFWTIYGVSSSGR